MKKKVKTKKLDITFLNMMDCLQTYAIIKQ